MLLVAIVAASGLVLAVAAWAMFWPERENTSHPSRARDAGDRERAPADTSCQRFRAALEAIAYPWTFIHADGKTGQLPSDPHEFARGVLAGEWPLEPPR